MAATPQTIDRITFVGMDKLTCQLLVPKDLLAAYSSATGWKDFLNRSEITKLVVQQESTILFAGQTTQLQAITLGGETVIWESSDESVATVDAATGLVTAVAAGEATINASINDGAHTATSDITVFASACTDYTGSGKDGTLFWALCTDGTLRIVCTGAIPNYTSSNGRISAPWYVHRNDITSVEISEGVTSIGQWAFGNCSRLTSITIPESVKYIGSSAFRGCSGLISITIPESVTSIGSSAFYGCSGLTSITIPEEVTSISDYAFYGCSGLTYIVNMATTPQTISSSTFSGVDKSTCLLWVPEGSLRAYRNTAYWEDFLNRAGQDDVVVVRPAIATLFVGQTKQLDAMSLDGEIITWESNNESAATVDATGLVTAMGAGEVTITASINGGAESADATITVFAVCDDYIASGSAGTLIWTLCPDGTLQIAGTGIMPDYGSGGAPWYAHRNNITSVAIGEGVTRVGAYAFYQCSNMSSIHLPATLTSIGTEVFWYCSKLSTVTIPASVTDIADYAFEVCTGLTKIVNMATTPQKISGYVFSGVNKSTCQLLVPENSLAAYRGTNVWKDFANIVSIEGATSAITSVTVTPTTVTVQKGKTQKFTANVTAMGDVSTAVTWSVTGKTSATTGINATGLLTVAASETATALTVTATSVFDNTKKGTASVTVTGTPVTPSVTSVTVIPATATVQKGKTQRFTANVTAMGGASEVVTWSVSGNKLAGTRINDTGLLTVAAGETATALTVTATSVFDNTKKGTASVTITGTPVTSEDEVAVSGTVAGASAGAEVQLYKSAAGGTVKASVPDGYTLVASTITDAGGNYTFDHLPAGVYIVLVVMPGTESTPSDPILLGEGETADNVNFTVQGNTVIPGDGVTGVSELFAPDLKVYPNPFTGTVHLTGAEGCTLRVINAAGTTVHVQNIESPDETIRLEQLPAGMYFFRIEKEGRTKTVKTIKN